MSQGDKTKYYQALKSLGVTFEKHYRDYTTDELKAAYAAHVEAGGAKPLDQPTPEPEPQPADTASSVQAPPREQQASPAPPAAPSPPVAHRKPDEMAGERLNTKEELEPIRTDPDTGFIWYQEEVQKKGYAAPRGRRVLKYNDPGFKEAQATVGEYTETFEVAGDQQRVSEAKITLPSYQVGIYKDPRFPFKIHIYNGKSGFNLFDVERYWGGAERVPDEVLRTYVANVLCYDMRTVVRAIETEYRQLRLAGKV